MPQFAWEGKTRTGETQKGVMEADAEPEVAQRLRASGIALTKAKKKGKDINIKIPGMGGPSKVKEKDLVVFTRMFATMIDAGLPIVQCLDILSQQAPTKNFGDILRDIKSSVEQGSTFSDALRKQPKAFDELYTNLVQAG